VGLIIVDSEEDDVYKQEQAPHYSARQAAFMRSLIEGARLILGSISPSLESIYLAKNNKIDYVFIPRLKPLPEFKVIDMASERRHSKDKNAIFSKYLIEAVNSALSRKEKVLLFLNRRGFATTAFCSTCGLAINCPRCDVNLVYHFKAELLTCRYCNFKLNFPKICPSCNSGYIKLKGAGTERIESELSRIFPAAKIKRLDSDNLAEAGAADIFVATSSVISDWGENFTLTGVLSIDNSLNRVDLRSSEKTFALLQGLFCLTQKRLLVQTGFPGNNCFQALFKNDFNLFYDAELTQRKHLGFPPYRHFISLRLRGKTEGKVADTSQKLFEQLNNVKKDRQINLLSLSRPQPAKLRGNYYWQILLSVKDISKARNFLKNNLKDFSRSGIIVTVDVDPI
ncbi:MAG: primosomal protein N', partial [Candidatus Omnitrophota bacterium]